MRNRNRIIFLIVVAVLFIVGLRLFSPRSGSGQVLKVQVTRNDLEISTSVSGKIKALKEVSLSLPITGKLTQVATEGAQVGEGEAVAMIDTFDLYSAYQSSLANLNKARSAYSNAIEAKAELDATYAGREGDNIVKAKLAEGKTNVEMFAAALDGAKFSSDQALASLTKAIIRAPFSGSVVKVGFKIGEVAPATAEVLRVADLSSFYFEAEADETDVGSLKLGDMATLKLDAFTGQEFKGAIFAIDSTSHTTSSGGTAYNVKIKIDNQPGVTLRSGLNGEADMVREVKRGVLTIPSAFVYEREGKNFVSTLRNDGQSEEREVSLGEFVDGRYEITNGLKIGETVTRKIQK